MHESVAFRAQRHKVGWVKACFFDLEFDDVMDVRALGHRPASLALSPIPRPHRFYRVRPLE
jgi:hypothetical protein